MADYDKTVLIGNLGADPELRHTTTNNVPIMTVNVATNRYQGKGTDRQKITTWLPVVLRKQMAEYAANYLKKGSKVFIEGYHQNRVWEDEEGKKQYITEIVATDLQGLDVRHDD